MSNGENDFRHDRATSPVAENELNPIPLYGVDVIVEVPGEFEPIEYVAGLQRYRRQEEDRDEEEQ